MKKKTARKLTLSRETLKALAEPRLDHLDEVRGGVSNIYTACCRTIEESFCWCA